eukprot:809806-Prymnesium_polylepis.1
MATWTHVLSHRGRREDGRRRVSGRGGGRAASRGCHARSRTIALGPTPAAPHSTSATTLSDVEVTRGPTGLTLAHEHDARPPVLTQRPGDTRRIRETDGRSLRGTTAGCPLRVFERKDADAIGAADAGTAQHAAAETGGAE